MAKKYETLTTLYSEKISDIPWSVYPRPQFKRDSFINLNGYWDFKVSLLDELPSAYHERILVPFPPESALSGIERKVTLRQILYYRRQFSLPDGFSRGKIILNFGAVDCICHVFINGSLAGKNEGGYLPFSIDITPYITDGDNEIVVKVKDGTNRKYPYGKQTERRGGMWYTAISGIWQTVWLESLPEGAIEQISIFTDTRHAEISIRTDSKSARLTLKETGESFDFKNGRLTVTPNTPKLWRPETPYLYEFTVETDSDKIESYFALREISVIEAGGAKRLALNGKPYLFSGLLDQGYFPDGIFLPATAKGYEDDILRAKRLGFNMLRKHIKIEPMIFYHLCDRLGMAVFQDMVNNGSYSFMLDTALPTLGIKAHSRLRRRTTEQKQIFEEQMLGAADLFKNTPSVLQYTVFNEGWGQFDADLMYKRLKGKDPTRIIDTTSGWFAEKLSDVDSRHIYFRLPNVKNPNGRPIFLSEFGGYSLRIESHLFGHKNYGYKRFDSTEAFSEAISELYLKGALPLIREGLSALVYTQLTDVEDETNGLITYDRRVVKVNYDMMSSLNEALYAELERIISATSLKSSESDS